MLWDDLKKRNIQAMKEKDTVTRGILSIILGKLVTMSKDKEIQDSDVLVLLQKTSKELDEQVLEFEKANRPERVAELKVQKEFVESYLPKMLTEEEIVNIINSLEDKSIQNVMKHFKANYTGVVDMKLVSTIAKKC